MIAAVPRVRLYCLCNVALPGILCMVSQGTQSSLHQLGPDEPAWDIARLFPNQGHWSEQEYLALDTNRLVEFTDGHVEVLSMPTMIHQLIVIFLFDAMRAFVNRASRGTVLLAPFRVRLRTGKFREPDITFMLAENDSRIANDFWDGADLVMEVVSDDDRRRDLETKRADYASARIPEYWIVDPHLRQITVLKLNGERYDVHGVFNEQQHAASNLLPGFTVDVNQVFSAGARP